jgi:hypothetical protein
MLITAAARSPLRAELVHHGEFGCADGLKHELPRSFESDEGG